MFSFSKLLVLPLLCSGWIAQADIFPSVGEKTCYRREYSEAYLKENPKQVLTSMYVIASTRVDEGYTWSSSEVAGISREGGLFLNSSACSMLADGRAFCQIDCDGGSFYLVPRKAGGLYFRVTEDYYFPLYREGVNEETATQSDTLSFLGKDKNNSLYKLFKAPMSECEKIFNKAKQPQMGC
jgi:hypothetical protein